VAIMKEDSVASLEEGNMVDVIEETLIEDENTQEINNVEVDSKHDVFVSIEVDEMKQHEFVFDNSHSVFPFKIDELDDAKIDVPVTLWEHDITSVEQLDASVIPLIEVNETLESVHVVLSSNNIENIFEHKDPEVSSVIPIIEANETVESVHVILNTNNIGTIVERKDPEVESAIEINETVESDHVILNTNNIEYIVEHKDPEVKDPEFEAAILNFELTSPVFHDSPSTSDNINFDSHSFVVDDDSVSVHKDLDFFMGNNKNVKKKLKKGRNKKSNLKVDRPLESKKKSQPSKSTNKSNKKDNKVEVPLLMITQNVSKQEEEVQKLTLTNLFADDIIHADIEAAYDMSIDWNSSFDINHW